MSLTGAVRAVRRFCLDCQGGSPPAVASCLDVECPFYPVRDAKPEPEGKTGEVENSVGLTPVSIKNASPLRLIRSYCLGCAGARREVRECDAMAGCPLWSYRFGVRPSTFKRVSYRLKKERQSLKLPGL